YGYWPKRTDFEATESYDQRICCTAQWPLRFQSNTDGVCIAYGYWRRRTDYEAHRVRGAPNPMSSIFAALVSGRFVSNRILMEYKLHTDTGRGAQIPRRTDYEAHRIQCPAYLLHWSVAASFPIEY